MMCVREEDGWQSLSRQMFVRCSCRGPKNLPSSAPWFSFTGHWAGVQPPAERRSGRGGPEINHVLRILTSHGSSQEDDSQINVTLQHGFTLTSTLALASHAGLVIRAVWSTRESSVTLLVSQCRAMPDLPERPDRPRPGPTPILQPGRSARRHVPADWFRRAMPCHPTEPHNPNLTFSSSLKERPDSSASKLRHGRV